MYEILNNFLLAGINLCVKCILRQLGLTYCSCGTFTKSKERMQNFKETGDSQYICQNELNEICFQHDIAYGDFKDLTKFLVLLLKMKI